MSIFCFGLSHWTAALVVRERFAVPLSALPEALAQLKTMPGVTQGVIVSTCNRTEFYVTGTARGHLSSGLLRELLSRFPSSGRKALFRLCAGSVFGTYFEGLPVWNRWLFGKWKFLVNSSALISRRPALNG
jgi:hypothetical protein